MVGAQQWQVHGGAHSRGRCASTAAGVRADREPDGCLVAGVGGASLSDVVAMPALQACSRSFSWVMVRCCSGCTSLPARNAAHLLRGGEGWVHQWHPCPSPCERIQAWCTVPIFSQALMPVAHTSLPTASPLLTHTSGLFNTVLASSQYSPKDFGTTCLMTLMTSGSVPPVLVSHVQAKSCWSDSMKSPGQ